jgi:uncharacterized caspase-like protein
MNKLALLVGINQYESDAFENLSCCEADAIAMDQLLARHWSAEAGVPGPQNYATRLLTSSSGQRISADLLRQSISTLMNHTMGDGDVLFYFSGHGVATDAGGFLLTQEATPEALGYPMQELLDAANRSKNNSVVIILDCCHSGQIGNLTRGEGFNQVSIGPTSSLRYIRTAISASRFFRSTVALDVSRLITRLGSSRRKESRPCNTCVPRLSTVAIRSVVIG